VVDRNVDLPDEQVLIPQVIDTITTTPSLYLHCRDKGWFHKGCSSLWIKPKLLWNRNFAI